MPEFLGSWNATKERDLFQQPGKNRLNDYEKPQPKETTLLICSLITLGALDRELSQIVATPRAA
jgi:hypothetical protein